MYCYQCCHLSQQPHNEYPETLFEYGQDLRDLELYTTYVSHPETAQGLNPYYIPYAFEACQAAIDEASKVNREKDLNAASVLLTINGHSLWEAQRQQFPEPINIQEYNQRATTENDSIYFWLKFNNCWLELGRNISEILQQCTHLDCNAKDSLEEWLNELVEPCHQRIRLSRGLRPVACFGGCFEALKQIGTTSFNSQGSYEGTEAQMTQQ
ncbi:uncharacterized protein BDW43DRAFT_304529 [Aspergillus alliaceus]|uniref:uncharacterized protein n=1 Tax=Petromyces alliaceus TaxID=209559 RepID=UPI0012A76962|nr:uncharacterized protein BDW43DRAFT_304529 [Aspergillus alliaceus]KAB8227550.1 hypothetical protein BDW43DRAFT_304529 [Aspergillus alliaceus]